MKSEKSRKHLVLCVGVLAFCAIGLAPRLKAQVQTLTGIKGTVTDPSGGIIPGASVTIRNQDTGATRQMKTGADGSYSFPSILPGTYTIKVEQPGFAVSEIKDRIVLATQPANVDVTLAVGSTTQTVTVSAPGEELISTSQAITGTITPSLVQNLPAVRRNFLELLILAPGVVPQDTNRGGAFGLSQMKYRLNYVSIGNTETVSGVFVGGNRESASNVSVDGANVQNALYNEVTQQQSIDTIQELRVETANMNAEFGFGASAVQVITKSGSNQFHGSVFDYLRNNHLDANGFFNNLQNQKLPVYQSNQFGFTFGGRAKRDKLFFFTSYQGDRARQGVVGRANVPPNAWRQGDFSQPASATSAVIPIYNPYKFDPVTGLREQFPGNQVPLGPTDLCAPRPTCLDPATGAFLQQWVLPPNATFNGVPVIQGLQRSVRDSDQFTVRLDYIKSANTTLYGRFTRAPVRTSTSGLQPLQGANGPYGGYTAVLNWIETISARMVNHFVASYGRFYSSQLRVPQPDVTTAIGIKGTEGRVGGPAFNTGFDMDSTASPNVGTTNIYQLQDDLSIVSGKHDIKMGFAAIERRLYYAALFADKGSFGFGGYTTACPPGAETCLAAATAAGVSQGGHPFADYLLGAYTSAQLFDRAVPYHGYQRYYGVYAQDSWRATSKLTVNYGLRYEYYSPMVVPRNTTISFDPNTALFVYALQNPVDFLDPSKCFGRCAPLTPGVPRAGYTSGNLNFAPRLGFAYRFASNTVFRTSAGIFYDGKIDANQISQIQSGGPPFTLVYQDFPIPRDTPVPALLVSDQFLPTSPTALPAPNSTPPVSGNYIKPFRPTPVVYQWSADLQQRVAGTWGLDLIYMGSHTIHEPMYIETNLAALPQGEFANLTLQERRPYPQWGTLATWDMIGWAKYNALIATFKNSTPWHGLTLLTNFTWGKNLVSSHWGWSDRGNIDFRNPYLWQSAYPSVPPVRLVAGYSYALPFGRGKPFAQSLNPVLDKLASGWQVSGMTTFQKGAWDAIIDFTPNAGNGTDRNMPNRICDPSIVPGGRTRLQWYNKECFTPAAFGTWGNANYAVVPNPGVNNFDLSIQKLTRIGPGETGELEFRLEMYNAFNHTQWGSNGSFTFSGFYPNLGQITSTRPARQMQFALRYRF